MGGKTVAADGSSHSNSVVLAVAPSRLEFPVQGARSERLRVQNVGHKSLSLHARAPQSSGICFTGNMRVFRLAPGMHVYVDLVYNGVAKHTVTSQEEIVFKYEGGCTKIPIIYQPMCAKFELRGDLDCGIVSAGSHLVKQLSVVNCGSAAGPWSLRTESELKMEANPSGGELAAGASAVVTLTIPELDPGEWVGHLQLMAAENSAHLHQYDVKLQAVTGIVELQGELGHPLHEIDFGARLNNALCRKTMLIMNGSPVPVKYAIEVISETSSSGQSIDMEKNAQESQSRVTSFIDAARTRAQMRGRHDVPFHLSPSHGEVAPFQKASITVIYAPRIESPETGFSAKIGPGCVIHNFVGKIDLQGTTNRISQMPLKGRCEFQVAAVSPECLQFGESSNLSVAIRNHARETIIRYHIRKAPAFFRIDGPQLQALVQPQQAATVTVMYRPKALGLHTGDLSVAILAPNGKVVEEHVVAVTGSCGSMVAGQLDLSTVTSRAIPSTSKRQTFRSAEANDTLNLGLDTWKGLGTGDPGKPNSAVNGLGRSNRNAPATFTAFPGLTGFKANIRPFKQWPETQDEARITALTLDGKQIRSILAGPSVLHFGTCSSAEKITKQFYVANAILQPLHVVPAGQTAMFPITLLSGSSRTFHHNVDVVVNGAHFFHVTVQADIIDPAVRLSHTDVEFALSAKDWLDHCDKLVLMENHQAVPCSYEWCNPMSGVYHVAPMHGCVPPYSSSEALIRWSPPREPRQGGSQQQCNLALKVNGSIANTIRLTGQVPEGNLQCLPKVVDLRAICLGLPVKVTADLTNEGELATAFRCLALTSTTTCHPNSSIVEASESVAIEVCFTPDEVGLIQTCVEFEQRCGSCVSLTVAADVRIPKDIRFVEDKVDFGTLYQGASSKVPLTLVNSEHFSCEVEIDISSEPMLTLSLGPSQWDPSTGTDSPLQESTDFDQEHVYVLLMEIAHLRESEFQSDALHMQRDRFFLWP